MARSDKRYSVYPSPKAIQVIGASSPSLNQAIECWAGLIARATADNGRKFSQPDATPYGEDYLEEWAVLAEALKDKAFDPAFANPAELLATAVEDAQRFENIGIKWFRSETDASDKDYVRHFDESIQGLAKRLRELDYAHAWAVIIAVQWYWEHSKELDIKKDPWWRLGFRREKEGQIPTLKESQGRKSKRSTKLNQD